MDSIDDKMFKRMFRMSKHAFSNLLGLLEDHYEERDSASVRQATNSSGSVVSPKTALAVIRNSVEIVLLIWGEVHSHVVVGS